MTIRQTNSAKVTAIQRGMVTVFREPDSGIAEGLMGDALQAAQNVSS
jgi:hypothetical protein